ncbi:hypothetical protein BV22DRAFT_1030995 [Leucogyrophana mollusca]|uniref:Uncharacterized protein n=1 Tax=Leucogyrophana mollusca TaxID=85980 RepID=A0ACB8BRV0_9AGAM|nr:hypothetical protein BV22DRAFT_1030995 [Leucogyrophana mollusca]
MARPDSPVTGSPPTGSGPERLSPSTAVLPANHKLRIPGTTSGRALIDQHNRNVLQTLLKPPTIKQSLEGILERSFRYTGQHCHCVTLIAPSNPCLHFDGFGAVGLPLSGRDAESLKVFSTNSEAPNCWQIWVPCLTTRNPAWDSFMEAVVTIVWQALIPFFARPNWQLTSMVLQGTGATLPPHKRVGTTSFATLDIVLPSSYEGGQWQVGHGDANSDFSLSQFSAFTTYLLAWHSDATVALQPVTSGYRAVLRYQLFHQPHEPMTCLPNMLAPTRQLRDTLAKWINSSDDAKPKVLAYVMRRDYGQVPVRAAGDLRGEDFHRAAHLRPICEQLGLKLRLARLQAVMVGLASDHLDVSFRGCGHRYQMGRPQLGTQPMPVMVAVKHCSILLHSLRDLFGFEVDDIGSAFIPPEDVLYCPPFARQYPDLIDYGGYRDEAPGTLHYWYSRDALVLYEEHKELEIFGKSSTIPSALQILNGVDPRFIYPREKSHAVSTARELASADNRYISAMSEIAIKWRDSSLWEVIVMSSDLAQKSLTLEAVLCTQACKTFSFANVMEILQRYCELVGVPSLRVVASLPSHVMEEGRFTAVRWCAERVRDVLGAEVALALRDADTLVAVVESLDLRFLEQVILVALLAKSRSRAFWKRFFDLLQEQYPELLTRGQGSDSDASTPHPDPLAEYPRLSFLAKSGFDIDTLPEVLKVEVHAMK